MVYKITRKSVKNMKVLSVKWFYLFLSTSLVILYVYFYELRFSDLSFECRTTPTPRKPWQQEDTTVGDDEGELEMMEIMKNVVFVSPGTQPTASQEACRGFDGQTDDRIAVNKTPPTSHESILDQFKRQKVQDLESGGYWSPSDCTPNCTTAIIIPYKNRTEQLKTFLRHMHPILQRKQIAYRIFVVEQNDNSPFNRAKLFNVGYNEAITTYAGNRFTCFVFHDVDLLLENGLNDYCCRDSPRYMCPAINIWKYASFSEYSFGGVVGFTKKAFEGVNGYSNKYWGWGAEDDDMFWRMHYTGLKVSRPSLSAGRYTMLSHGRTPRNTIAILMLTKTEKGETNITENGVTTLKYKVNKRINEALYTHLLVDLQMTEQEKKLTYMI